MKKIAFLLIALIPYLLSAQVEVKVMSYNIRLDTKSDGDNQWDLRKEKVATLMNYYEADFIGGQEVLNQQLEFLVQNLIDYSYIGVGRDDGKKAGEYSCIFYKKNRFDLLQQGTFWLSPTPDSISKGWDAALKRVCTYGLFKEKKSKQKLWVFNTHFDHVGKQARLESARLILEKIKEFNKGNNPVVLTGDFNSKPDEEPAELIVTKMQNSRSIGKLVHGGPDTWNAFRFNEKPNGCIDYIFVSNDKRITVTRFATLTDSYDLKYLSDHFPILATIRIE